MVKGDLISYLRQSADYLDVLYATMLDRADDRTAEIIQKIQNSVGYAIDWFECDEENEDEI